MERWIIWRRGTGGGASPRQYNPQRPNGIRASRVVGPAGADQPYAAGGYARGPAGASAVRRLLVPIVQAELVKPLVIGDYSDFMASIYHATNAGTIFNPNTPLVPNYKYMPIGYHRMVGWM
jgi:hypothetical protein